MVKELTPNPLSWEERELCVGKNEDFCMWPGAICARRPVGAYWNTPLQRAKKHTFFHLALRKLRKVSYQMIQQFVGQVAPLFSREGWRSHRLRGVSLTTLAIICFLSAQPTFAQDVILKLYAEDAKGNIDSVSIGFDYNSATLGIDSILGEKNIYGQTWDSLDIRVIQRDSANHHCIRESFYFWNAPRLYFPENIDSKIDFRSPDSGTPFVTVNNNFEIFVQAHHYPVTIKGFIIDPGGVWSFTGLFLLDSLCNNISDNGPPWFLQTIFTLPDSSVNTIVVNFQHEVSIDDLIQFPTWKLFPNPSSSKVYLENGQLFDGQIEVLSSDGRKMYSFSMMRTKQLEIDISGIPNGIFMLKYTERKSGKYSLQKLLIQH